MQQLPKPDARQRDIGNGQSAAESRQIRAPAISLPKGGGSIRGIGEKFGANPVTGTGSMAVPIATSPGRTGFGPELSLSYDSGAGSGPFGFGWILSVPSIARKTDKGLPRYRDAEESDGFVLSAAEDLVPVLVRDDGRGDSEWVREELPPRHVNGAEYRIQRYRPRIEGLFARIERWTNLIDPADTFWRSISRDNITTWYGKTAASRIFDHADRTRVFSWLICETCDGKGNVIVYEYKAEDSAGVDVGQAHERNRTPQTRSANRYLKRIRYGNRTPFFPNYELEQQPTSPLPSDSDWMFEVVLDYGEHDIDSPHPSDDPTSSASHAWLVRQDPFSSYRAGFEIRTYRLCRRILMFHHFPADLEVGPDCLVRSTDLDYRPSPIATEVRSITQSGYRRARGSDTYLKRSLPPLEFTYSQIEVDETVHIVEPESLEHLPTGLDGSRYQWVDLDGEGISGILTEQAGAWFYKRNLSPTHRVAEDGVERTAARFGPAELVATKPTFALAGGSQFLDLAGDGCLDLVRFEAPVRGFFERTHDADWESFRPFPSFPNFDFRDPNLKLIDLTGDGHGDILITEDEVFRWHPSLGEEGFGPAELVRESSDEESGPRLVFADAAQSIYLADMSGDGLMDLVRIRNGEVCYWPNLGYGRFGAKVSMDSAPCFDQPDQFDQRRIRVADIDGSGSNDIIYLGADGMRLYFNESGSRWSEPRHLRQFPLTDNLSSVMTADLLGNGTACLIWSSPLPGDVRQPMRYVDLMGGQKPHLLLSVRNNLGAETHIQYASSTKFYLADKAAGTPWITKIPFPVHVVESVSVVDAWRATRFTTTYSYHHGYFDGEEREFRGFGRVEQTDVEDFGTFTAGNVASPYITDDLTLYQPPVKTVTWFHTGIFLGREKILAQFQKEYFAPRSDSFIENLLPEPDLHDDELSAEEWREALRACKGMTLRQEVYELDIETLKRGGERRVRLFSTAYHNCHIQRLQAREPNRHAVFLVAESEAITYHYELDLRQPSLQPDPRIAHTLNLRTDEYGNVLEAIAVAYPRVGHHDGSLLPATAELIAQVQEERHLVYTANDFTNDVLALDDDYRLGVPCEVKTYELTGIEPTNGFYFTLDELRKASIDASVPAIAYHALPNGLTQKRLVEHERTLFFNAGLDAPLPLGQLNALGLPYESYTLALTDDLLTAIFTPEQLTPNVRRELADAVTSGYLTGTALTTLFGDGAGEYWIRSGIAGFAEDARDRFYLPEQYTDPFGNVTHVEYDRDHHFYVRSSTDPLDNTVVVESFDFRVLAPRRLRDINDNLSEVAFDVLGLPTAAAVLGKGNEGDRLDDISGALLDPDLDTIVRFFTGVYDETEARRLLGNATARHLYYLGERREADGRVSFGHHPACAAGLVRETHLARLEPGDSSRLQAAFEYSDGIGNVLVKKVQAEPESAGGPMRWIAGGKTILNNKGKPVKQYEPYFSERGHVFEDPPEVGVTSVLFYDAVGRLIRTDTPDGSFSRVEFSPWHTSSYDASDTVGESGNAWFARMNAASAPPEDQRAARMAAKHADTLSRTFLDSLGREVVGVSHNRAPSRATEFDNVPLLDRPWIEERYVTFTKLDAEGKPLWIRDDRGNRVMQYIAPPVADDRAEDPATGFVPCYDIAGNLLFQHSMDAGDRWMLMDAAGQPFHAWDVNGSERRHFTTEYDELRRPVRQWLRLDDAEERSLVERFVYGETLGDGPSQTRNLRGQVHQHFDPSGLETNEWFDFKGNLVEATRRLAVMYDAPIIDWSNGSPTAGLEDAAETFTKRMDYDALNRMTRMENWHLARREPAVYVPRYNERGLLNGETLTVRGEDTHAISDIEYNVKGQRQRIQYGNDTETHYDYDPLTFRLRQLRTTRPVTNLPFPALRSNLLDIRVVQQLHYTYDPVGNITEIYDEANKPVFFSNQKVEPWNRYVYDALYRLIEATGRENYWADGPPPQRLSDVSPVTFPLDGNVLRSYTQRYTYDSVGNIDVMEHMADRGSWTRNYEYAVDSNRLRSTWMGADRGSAVEYTYDAHGSMLNLDRTPMAFRLRWDYRDMIHTVNLGGGGRAWYNYDADKQRTRKRVDHNNHDVEERLYLDGMELYRHWRNGELIEGIETHHLFLDDQRVLMVDDVFPTDNGPSDEGVLLHRYQYGNHLGSVALELDAGGAIVSYEEYHPYGTTAYDATGPAVQATAKRYRYTGMERDEETGLSYHTARYYAPSLARWCSADPLSITAGANIYWYAKDLPVNRIDSSGTSDTPWWVRTFAAVMELLSVEGGMHPPVVIDTGRISNQRAPADEPTTELPTQEVNEELDRDAQRHRARERREEEARRAQEEARRREQRSQHSRRVRASPSRQPVTRGSGRGQRHGVGGRRAGFASAGVLGVVLAAFGLASLAAAVRTAYTREERARILRRTAGDVLVGAVAARILGAGPAMGLFLQDDSGRAARQAEIEFEAMWQEHVEDITQALARDLRLLEPAIADLIRIQEMLEESPEGPRMNANLRLTLEENQRLIIRNLSQLQRQLASNFAQLSTEDLSDVRRRLSALGISRDVLKVVFD